MVWLIIGKSCIYNACLVTGVRCPVDALVARNCVTNHEAKVDRADECDERDRSAEVNSTIQWQKAAGNNPRLVNFFMLAVVLF
jgi:hypothetical protein